MPIDFRILPSRGLVYIRYTGFITFAETAAVFADYVRHPETRPGQKQLVDLSRVTDWQKDFAGLIKLQAAKADAFVGVGHEVHFVYYAPQEHTRAMARMILRSWDEVPSVIPLLADSEADALHVLGQPETRFEDMLERA